MIYEFSKTGTDFRLRERKRFERWINHAIRQEKKKPVHIHFIFCSDREILRINKEFLGHNYYTDIITFDYTNKDGLSGEIYISADTVSSNARKYRQPLAREMRRVMIHGVLHLCGYKDKSVRDQQRMREREDFYLLLWPRFRNKS